MRFILILLLITSTVCFGIENEKFFLEMLGSSDVAMRRSAVDHFKANANDLSDNIVAALGMALLDTDAHVRGTAATIIGIIGEERGKVAKQVKADIEQSQIFNDNTKLEADRVKAIKTLEDHVVHAVVARVLETTLIESDKKSVRAIAAKVLKAYRESLVSPKKTEDKKKEIKKTVSIPGSVAKHLSAFQGSPSSLRKHHYRELAKSLMKSNSDVVAEVAKRVVPNAIAGLKLLGNGESGQNAKYWAFTLFAVLGKNASAALPLLEKMLPGETHPNCIAACQNAISAIK